MKKLMIAAIALVTLTFSASAQQKRMKGKHHAAYTQNLDLSEAQKAQAKLYKENYKKQVQDLEKNQSITLKEYREKKAALQQEQKANLQNLLTPVQKEKMAQMKTIRQAKGMQHDAARMEKMKAALNLTDTQAAQYKTQHEAMKVKMQAIKADDTMDKAAKKEKLMALKMQMKEENKKIFTTEQLKKMDEMKKNRNKKK